MMHYTSMHRAVWNIARGFLPLDAEKESNGGLRDVAHMAGYGELTLARYACGRG